MFDRELGDLGAQTARVIQERTSLPKLRDQHVHHVVAEADRELTGALALAAIGVLDRRVSGNGRKRLECRHTVALRFEGVEVAESIRLADVQSPADVTGEIREDPSAATSTGDVLGLRALERSSDAFDFGVGRGAAGGVRE